MPAYLFSCLDCQKEFTDFHGFDEKTLNCSLCGSENIKKIYGYINNSVKSSDIKPVKKNSGKKVRDFIQESTQSLKDYKKEQKK